MTQRIRATLILLTSVALIALSAPVRAEGQPTTGPSVTPDAQALLDQVRDAYAKLNSIELAGTLTIDIEAGGQTGKNQREFVASFQAPNKFRHEMKDDVAVVSTGEKLVLHLLPRNMFVNLDPPKGRDEAPETPAREIVRDQNPSLELAVHAQSFKETIENASSAVVQRLDDEKLDNDGTSYPVLRLDLPNRDVRLIIDPATHLVRRVNVDLRKSLEKANVPQIKRALVTIDYTKSRADAAVDGTKFAWSAPAGAVEVKPEALIGAAGGAAGGAVGSDPAMALVGKPAPDFKLEDASGKTVSLIDLKGSVTLLNFWTTWCPACQTEMPVLDKLATARADEGVKVFAINLREDPEKVRPFATRLNVKLPILFDFTGQVAEKYLVEPLPQTVIIDKKGIVRHVSLGFGPGSEAELNAAVDAALKH